VEFEWLGFKDANESGGLRERMKPSVHHPTYHKVKRPKNPLIEWIGWIIVVI
jgi:hypothetical protein